MNGRASCSNCNAAKWGSCPRQADHKTGASIMRYVLLALLFFPISSYAASFECSKASTSVEKAICADAELSKLDDRLAVSYKKALAAQPDSAELKTHQRNWLKNVRNQCQDVACLKEAYLGRLAGLEAFAEYSAGVIAPASQQTHVSPPATKESTPDPLIAKYSKSLKISQDFLSAPLAFQIGGKVDIPFVKFIDATFRFGKSKPTVKVDGNRVIVRMDMHDEVTDADGRTDYLIVAHEDNGKLFALVERMVITDSDGVQELEQHEIPTAFGLLWVPLIASMN